MKFKVVIRDKFEHTIHTTIIESSEFQRTLEILSGNIVIRGNPAVTKIVISRLEK
jgi:hypothetical protein